MQTLAPDASPSIVQSAVWVTFDALGFEQALTAARQAGPQEDDAGVDVRRMENELRRRRRMDSDAGYVDPMAERLLKARLHLQSSPGVRPALIGGAWRTAAERAQQTLRRCGGRRLKRDARRVMMRERN